MISVYIIQNFDSLAIDFYSEKNNIIHSNLLIAIELALVVNYQI